jgi:hypothetical protein
MAWRYRRTGCGANAAADKRAHDHAHRPANQADVRAGSGSGCRAAGRAVRLGSATAGKGA